MKRGHLFLALLCIALLIPVASRSQVPVAGPSTFTFTTSGQSNVWSCYSGQSSFALTVPSGLTGTFTVTVSQTSGGTYVNPPWSYAPGVSTYTNMITNSGSLTVNLGSNAYVKVADTSYSSGSVTVTGVCSAAVGLIPPPTPAPTPSPNASSPITVASTWPYTIGCATCTTGVTPGTNIVVTTPNPAQPTVAVAGAPAFSDLTLTDPNFNTSLNITPIAGKAAFLKMSSTSTGGNEITMTMTAPSPSPLTQLANINAYASGNGDGTLATDIESGIAGGATGNYGGFFAFHVKADGSDALPEALVLDAGAHVYPPNDVYSTRFNTPSTCAALVQCGTVTWTFASPFVTTSGGANTPICTAPSVQDESVPATLWLTGITALSSTAVTFEYGPAVALAAAHTIDISATCWVRSY